MSVDQSALQGLVAAGAHRGLQKPPSQADIIEALESALWQLRLMPMSQYDLVVLWTDDDWRCAFHRGVDGDGFLVIFHGERLVAAERTASETVATLRGEILYQRMLRGDLKDLNPPQCPKCGGVVRITGQRYPMVYFRCDACHVSGAYREGE